MGFDPRRWSSTPDPRRRQTVTSNVDALLAENESLRREVLQLKRQLDLLRQRHWRPYQSQQDQHGHQQRVDDEARQPSITQDQVKRWGDSLAQQQGWKALRLRELEQFIATSNRDSFHKHLNLQQRLDRLRPGLGSDLFAATGRKPLTKKQCAVHAAFALYGIRTQEWLNEDPQRVVAELLNRQQGSRQSRRTRSDQRASDRNSYSDRSHTKTTDFTINDAYQTLELDPHASHDEIKQAYRRLVKQHHPDLGGSVEQFRKVYEAYQKLTTKR